MSYESEIIHCLGQVTYDTILDAVDNGEIGQVTARDLAKQLHPKVGGSFIHASMERNFIFNRRAMREILSNWYQFCVPEDPVKDLITALRHEDVQLEALANKLQVLNTTDMFHIARSIQTRGHGSSPTNMVEQASPPKSVRRKGKIQINENNQKNYSQVPWRYSL